MSLLTILALALGLALDAFSVGIAVGIRLPKLSFRPIFRLSWHFGLFQFLMPILGWLAGVTIQSWVAAFDHWIAFGLLTAVGGKMIYESFKIKKAEKQFDPTSLITLLALAVATSIDALAVGITLSLIAKSIIVAVIIIGVVTFVLSYLGVAIGKRFGHFFESKIEVFGGAILIAIAVKILVEHTL